MIECLPEAAELLREFDATGFADDGDADLAGVLEFVFDAATQSISSRKQDPFKLL